MKEAERQSSIGMIGDFVGVMAGITRTGVAVRECRRTFAGVEVEEERTTVDGSRELGFMARRCAAGLQWLWKRTGTARVTSVRHV